MIKIKINGKEILARENENVLETALSNGIYIPHLCHHSDLPEHESCRLCLVENLDTKEIVPSCSLKVREGLNICTKNEQIDKLRNLAMELLLAAHPEDCSACPKYGRCELQTLIQYMGVSAMRMRTRIKGFKESRQQLLIHDMNRCVTCGRCVRACNDLRGVGVRQFNKKDMETYVGTLHDKLLKDADCRFCGACAEVCPTGTIRDIVNYTSTEKKDALIPCKAQCLVHTDIPRYVRYASKGEFDKATAVIHEKIPFPECLGRVCAHTCEEKCRRNEINEAISIRNIKRYAAEKANNDMWMDNSKRLPDTNKKVCIVGGGPAGLTAAFYLAKQGHKVTIKEQYEELGGQMRYGIPSYRLPREVIEKEAGYAKSFGVQVETGVKVDRPAELLNEFDAVLMAIGTHQGVRLPIEGNDLPGVILNTDFLRDVSMGKEPCIGNRVIVLGGGNVAFDCARSARKLGSSEVHVACLESRENMLADEEEIVQAQEEGIYVHPSQSFIKICGDESVTGVQFMNVESFTFDENRKAIVKVEENSEHTIQADTVIFAVGQRTAAAKDSGLVLGRGNSIVVDDELSGKTNMEGIFACGDAVYGTKTVINAVASGRKAAMQIDKYLGGDGDISEELLPKEEVDSEIGKVDKFACLDRAKPQITSIDERKNSFCEVDSGISSEEICKEAGRCLQCDLRFNIKSPKIWSDFGKEDM